MGNFVPFINKHENIDNDAEDNVDDDVEKRNDDTENIEKRNDDAETKCPTENIDNMDDDTENIDIMDDCVENLSSMENIDDDALQFVFLIDFNIRPRLDRARKNKIIIHSKINAQMIERMLAIFTAITCGWQENSIKYKTKQRIAVLACMQTAYDYGYVKPFSHRGLLHWYQILNRAIDSGKTNDKKSNTLSTDNKGSVKYTDTVENSYPRFLHELFHYSSATHKKYLARMKSLMSLQLS